MKSFIFLAVLFTTSAFATPIVTARNVTCQELQDLVANYKSVEVKSRFLGIPTSVIVKDRVNCFPEEVRTNGVFRTQDKLSCIAGEYCTRRQPNNF